jgi:uncharacterized membrane protein YvbJ
LATPIVGGVRALGRAFFYCQKTPEFYQSAMTNSMAEQNRQKFHRRRRRKFGRRFLILLGALILAGALVLIIYFFTRTESSRPALPIPNNAGVQFN